jgi:multiple sugar transport system substrate-binding protein
MVGFRVHYGIMRSFWARIFRQAYAAAAILLCVACQGGPVVNQVSPTATGDAPTPKVTLPPLDTPTPMPTPTLETPAYLRLQPAELKGQQVRFWHALTGDGASRLEALVREFNQKNEWGIQIKSTALGASGPLASAVDQAQPEDIPEVVLAPSEQLMEWQQARSLLVDLNLYLAQKPWGMPETERDGYLPVFWKQDQFPSKDQSGNGPSQIGIPALRTATGLIYNRSFAAELGFTSAPGTPQELLDQACAASKKNNGFINRMGTGGWMLDTSSFSALSWIAAFGADAVPAGPEDAWHFDQPKAVDALRFLRGMQEKGCLWESKQPTPYEYFGDRMALFSTATFQDLALQAGYLNKIASKDEWIFIPFPGMDGKPVLYSYGYSYGLLGSKSPVRQMAAWLFIRWMSQPENQISLATAWYSFPVTKSEQDGMSAKQAVFPWNNILPLETAVRPAPTLASWPLVRRPLEDAFWQLFNLASADQIPQLLPQLDQMSAELIQNQK